MKNCLSKKGKIIAVILAVLLIICASGYIYSIYSENQKKDLGQKFKELDALMDTFNRSL